MVRILDQSLHESSNNKEPQIYPPSFGEVGFQNMYLFGVLQKNLKSLEMALGTFFKRLFEERVSILLDPPVRRPEEGEGHMQGRKMEET